MIAPSVSAGMLSLATHMRLTHAGAFFIYAKRRGTTMPRPMAGPYATRLVAQEDCERVRRVGVAKHYLSPFSDDVYVGAVRPDMAGRVGVLNQWLDLAPVPAIKPEA